MILCGKKRAIIECAIYCSIGVNSFADSMRYIGLQRVMVK